MPFNISDELKRTFDLASLQFEASKKLNEEEWKEYGKIKEKYRLHRRYETRQYELQKEDRRKQVKKRLIDKAGAKTKTFKHRWFGSDQFDKSAIDRQAHREVKAALNKTLAQVDQKEGRELEALIERRDKRVKPGEDFEKATDRRTKTDRRHKATLGSPRKTSFRRRSR